MVKARVGMIGGRGYVGEELLRLIERHPKLELAWVSSRSLAGKNIRSVYPDLSLDMPFESISPDMLSARKADVIVLALPNGMAAAFVERLHPDQKVVDLSADYRFDEAWHYGLPELNRQHLKSATRVSNPGCYATAIQLALAPLLPHIDSAPVAFGVSGYSGAGRTPSERNSPDRLRNNLQPYSLSGHVHEREVSHHLKRQINFLPHVAEYFRGISITISARLTRKIDDEELLQLFREFYVNQAFINISDHIPEVREVAGTPSALIGGFTVDNRDARQVCLVSCIDNLLKGAASQAIQNINLMLELDERTGIANSSR